MTAEEYILEKCRHLPTALHLDLGAAFDAGRLVPSNKKLYLAQRWSQGKVVRDINIAADSLQDAKEKLWNKEQQKASLYKWQFLGGLL